MKFRNRIKAYREINANELAPNPRNWRTHPEAQINALRGVLADVGFAAPVVAYETDGGLMLIDGHARVEQAGSASVPAVILDVDDAEAALLLATLDPIGDLAGANTAALDDLLRDVSSDSPAVAAMLSELAFDVEFDIEQLTERNTIKTPIISVVQAGFSVTDLAIVEQAIKATGKRNRGEAITELARSYLGEG